MPWCFVAQVFDVVFDWTPVDNELNCALKDDDFWRWLNYRYLLVHLRKQASFGHLVNGSSHFRTPEYDTFSYWFIYSLNGPGIDAIPHSNILILCMHASTRKWCTGSDWTYQFNHTWRYNMSKLIGQYPKWITDSRNTLGLREDSKKGGLEGQDFFLSFVLV